MTTSGDAAESVIRMSLEGTEIVLRLTGSAAKNVMAAFYALYKDNKQIKGKTNVTNMLKTGKELKVFTIKKEDLALFKKEAKRYGVLYASLIDRKNKNFDGLVDIMVKAEDAPKINRIVKRFKLSSYDETTIKTEIEKEQQQEKSNEIDKLVDNVLVDSDMDSNNISKDEKDSNINDLIDNVLDSENKGDEKVNPSVMATAKDSLSANSSENKKTSEMDSKKSVKEELNEIKKELEKEEKDKNRNEKTKAMNKKSNKRKKTKKSKGGR